METRSSVPDVAVIGQEEESELHLQPVLQGGRRQLDIRLWRNGAPEQTPGHTGLTLLPGDLGALQAGIARLLETSDGGRRAARVVWDAEDERRLRAETEPFGTRYLARFGFWQRVRDTWKPIDDGLVLVADSLEPLQKALDRFRPWLLSEPVEETPVVIPVQSQILDRWPEPGADWLTLEPERIAFHPRGVRITCVVMEEADQHWLVIRQWRREDSIWVPEPVSLALTITDLDAVLSCLVEFAEASDQGEIRPKEETASDGSTLRVGIFTGETRLMLRIDQRLPERLDHAPDFEPRVWLPAEYLPRFGRALAQGWFLLTGWLSETERTELQQRDEPVEAAEPAPASEEAPAPETESEPDEPDIQVAGSRGEDLLVPAAEPAAPHLFVFGAESRTPGTLIREAGQIRIVVEGEPHTREAALPLEVAPRVVAGLETLNALYQKQARVDPVLLCDRPSCAVYGRVGTSADPNLIELRVWSDPTTSASVSFEAVYLPELIDVLRRSLRPPGEWSASPTPDPAPGPPAPRPLPGAPARMRIIAPATPLIRPGPIVSSDLESSPPLRLSRQLANLDLGGRRVSFSLEGHRANPLLTLQWDRGSIEVPLANLEELLTHLRTLYYDALRGRRGRTVSIGQYPAIAMSIHNQGAELDCILTQETDGEMSSLSFPAGEVPSFLDAARTALSTR